MENDRTVKICLAILILLFFFSIYYSTCIRPHIIGTYTPTKEDCKSSYECTCVKDDCLCTYKKWFRENKVVCDKESLLDSQIKN